MGVEGVKIGLDSLYYALLTADASGGASYGTPVAIEGAISANVNPNSVIGTLFADDGPMEVSSNLGNIELELNVADLPLATLAVFLGHTMSLGVLAEVANAVPPWMAIGFRTLKSNSNYRYYWLVKGKFRTPEENAETKSDAVNFQTPTIVGHFVKREYDSVWRRRTDADDDNYVTATGTNWFTSPDIGD